jgi:hypothetical protein
MAYVMMPVPCSAAEAAVLGALGAHPRDQREIVEEVELVKNTFSLGSICGSYHKRCIKVGAPYPIISKQKTSVIDGTDQQFLWLAPWATTQLLIVTIK